MCRTALVATAAILLLLCSFGTTLAQSPGSILAWGSNSSGQCNVPEPGVGFVMISAGGDHNLGLRADGTIAAWGRNVEGQCNVPAPNADFVAVAAGASHSLGRKADGRIVAWGFNFYGQCNVPAPNADFVAVAGGTDHSLGLKSDGTIVVWGDNNWGQRNVPAPNADFVAIAAGGWHSAAIKVDGSVVAWGRNGWGQCNVPAPNTDFVAIALGAYFSLGLKSDGRIVGWGHNDEGPLNIPQPNVDWVYIAANGWNSMGIKADGRVLGWGWNACGQCNIPEPNPGFQAVAAGLCHSLGLTVGGVNITHTPLNDTSSPGPFTVSASIAAFGPNPLNLDSTLLWYSTNGGAFASVLMTSMGGSVFEAQIPAQSPGTAIAYYITAETTTGVRGAAPLRAPADYFLFGSGSYNVDLDDNIESDLGWTVTEPGTGGTWERADPNGTYAGTVPVNPEDDHTPEPGVMCWVTGNPPPGSFYFIEEVDGRTSVVSPLIDMTGATMARGSVWIWTYLANGNIDDHVDLSVSSDGGTTWTLLTRWTTPGAGAWHECQFTLNPFSFTFGSQMRFKCTAEDIAPDTIVEAGLDDFLVRSLVPNAGAAPGPADSRPVTYVLYPSQPNPFNPRTEIRYELPAAGPVKLTVYDVSGRELKVLVDGINPAGAHSAFWDGTDGRGQPLASGVYFYLLQAGDFSQMHRMVLVK